MEFVFYKIPNVFRNIFKFNFEKNAKNNYIQGNYDNRR